MTNLANRLIRKREAAKLSQSQLAAKAKLKNQSIIGMLESGARTRLKPSSNLPANHENHNPLRAGLFLSKIITKVIDTKNHNGDNDPTETNNRQHQQPVMPQGTRGAKSKTPD